MVRRFVHIIANLWLAVDHSPHSARSEEDRAVGHTYWLQP